MTVVEILRGKARALKQDTLTLYLAVRDPRTPWYAKAVAAAVVAYALSPLDLIPDFIPILGYVDDLIVVPLGIALALKLVPEHVITDCRERTSAASGRPTSRIGAAFMIGVWLVAAGWAVLLVKNVLAAK
jgi:uncharacterized membrane protein YkvA (DUF1232 family)